MWQISVSKSVNISEAVRTFQPLQWGDSNAEIMELFCRFCVLLLFTTWRVFSLKRAKKPWIFFSRQFEIKTKLFCRHGFILLIHRKQAAPSMQLCSTVTMKHVSWKRCNDPTMWCHSWNRSISVTLWGDWTSTLIKDVFRDQNNLFFLCQNSQYQATEYVF